MPFEGKSNNREILINRLVISPNLDALLEQEDKTRALLSPVSEMITTPLPPRSVSTGEEGLVGLPPPPRHPRVKLPRSNTRAVKPNLILDTELQARETPAKPAPAISAESPLSRSTSVSNPFINPAPTLADLRHIQRVREPSNQQISELSSLPSDSHDGSESPSPIIFSSPWSVVNANAPIRNSSLRHRQQNSVDSHNKPWRHLHGNSYANRPSPGHAHISSTREPANVARKLSSISISSTVYAPSDKGARSYNDPVPSNSEKTHSRSHSVTHSTSTSMDCPQISPIRFSRHLSDSWPSLYASPSFSSSKPDLPTTLEPIISSTPMTPELSRPLPRPLPPIPTASRPPLSPTTNFLDSGERADLVRKTRKLARVFGKTPGADTIPVQEVSLPMSRYSSDSDWSRSPASQSDEVRRHSAPLSPDDVYSMSSQGSLSPLTDKAGHHVLNDTFDGGDTASLIKPRQSIPTQSQSELMFDDEEQTDERKRKREKLAKLHRFLGSRVPINLVLGTDIEPTLPSPYFNPIGPLYRNEDGQTTWLKRRKSGSAIPFSPLWSNDLERVKEELNDKEKLINVRRAVKMEKVFGVAPPQTLYHTRHSPSPLSPANKLPPSEGPSLTGSAQRNSKRSTYSKQKLRKNSRPSTADSDLQLVPKVQETSAVEFVNPWGTGHSNIYNSYQFSLISLQDILASDDRESLVELHQYLNTEETSPSSPSEVSSVTTGNRMSNASFFGRRRSLPVLSSRISLNSEYNATAPETNDVTGFQVRRRKAAKLTQFFGVDYRELINDVLQSIEHGVKNEHKSGTLLAEEAEDLLARLRKLKIKQPKSQSFLFLD